MDTNHEDCIQLQFGGFQSGRTPRNKDTALTVTDTFFEFKLPTEEPKPRSKGRLHWQW